MISCLILNYNSSNLTLQLINKIKDYSCLERIVVVDNNSTDGSQEILKEKSSHGDFKLLQSRLNNGYSYGNNIGIRWIMEFTNSKYVIVANPDVLFEEEYILNALKAFKNNSDYGLLSGVMLNPDNSVTHNQYWDIPSYWGILVANLFIFNKLYNLKKKDLKVSLGEEIINGVPAGSASIVDINVMKLIECYDEDFFLFYEENIIAFKMKKIGIKTGILTNSVYNHFHSQTIKKNMNMLNKYNIFLESQLKFSKKYLGTSGLKLKVLKTSQRLAKLIFQIKLKLIKD